MHRPDGSRIEWTTGITIASPPTAGILNRTIQQGDLTIGGEWIIHAQVEFAGKLIKGKASSFFVNLEFQRYPGS